jgi:pimeloyl-ACP methyl ester carboxylesterase
MRPREAEVVRTMKHRGSTRPFLGPDGTPLPGSIAEIEFVRLGGVEQWVMIRGERLTNPPLIVLHGGPGFSDTAFFRHFNAPLERHFTVVYWDQRGTGKSYDPAIPRSSMTVEQFIADLSELVEYVCTRVGQRRVTLFGHSWGSAFGLLYAVRVPERIAAYVGSGQVGNWQEAETASYTFALAEAERLGNARALETLRAIGPPPYSADSVLTERVWLQRLDHQLTLPGLWQMARLILARPEYSMLDLRNIVRGFRFSLECMWTEVSTLNLLTLAPVLTMPTFFFLGRRDLWVPPETSVAYFDVLRAPSKQLVWFENSGHEPFVDEPEKFNAAMIGLVRPVAMPVSAAPHAA